MVYVVCGERPSGVGLMLEDGGDGLLGVLWWVIRGW